MVISLAASKDGDILDEAIVQVGGEAMRFPRWSHSNAHRLRSVARELSDGTLRAVIVDQGFTRTGRSNERGDGSVVQRAGQTQAGFVEAGDRVVGELSRSPERTSSRTSRPVLGSCPRRRGSGRHHD